MARFRYQATDSDGKPINGEMEADSADEASARLQSDGAKVHSLEVVSAAAAPADDDLTADQDVQRMKVRDFRELSGHLGDITQAGLPIVQGLAALSRDLPNSRLCRGLRSIVAQLESGAELEMVLKTHGAPADLWALIAAGVRSGQTAELLGRYAAQSRQLADIKLRTVPLLIYPVVVLGAMIAGLLLILVWIVPQFKEIFEDFGVDLPAMTEGLFFVSDLLVEKGLWLAGGGILVAAAVWAVLALSLDAVSRRQVISTIPLVGPLLRNVSLSQFTYLLAILVENRVPLPQALTLAGDGISDAQIRAACWHMAADVEAGEPLHESAQRLPGLPATLVEALAWQKHPDAFPDALRAVADMFEARVRSQTSFLAVIWEPAMIIGMGIVLGLMLIALFMPLVELLNELS